MLVWVALGALLAQNDPGRSLLAAAEKAHAQNRIEERTRWMHGWASLGATPPPPDVLAPYVPEAESWVLESGRFRLFASRTADRVRVGVNDPARLVTRVEAVAESNGNRAPLQRFEAEMPDRMEYTIDPALPADATIEVRALSDVNGEEVVLRRVVLAKQELIPAAPSMKAAPVSRRGPPAIAEAPRATAIPWWWIALGVAAAGLAGAAIVQETRF